MMSRCEQYRLRLPVIVVVCRMCGEGLILCWGVSDQQRGPLYVARWSCGLSNCCESVQDGMAGTCRARERRRDRETDLRENSKRVERSTALVVEENLERNCVLAAGLTWIWLSVDCTIAQQEQRQS